MTSPDEERIALFLDYENLAIGAREALGGMQFDFKPIADALAERGRVVSRRAYADWHMFEEGRRGLSSGQVEMIEVTQRRDGIRKNAADIKMSVDAVELAFERQYVTTFVIGTGDSDFTPLVHKLRELNKRVIGFGIKASTSPLLPAACDEFLFYDNLVGVEPAATKSDGRDTEPGSLTELEEVISTTLAGLARSQDGPVLASMLKRSLLRKNSTFSEADYGFRGFGELMRHLETEGVVELAEGPAKGDPEISLVAGSEGEAEAFQLLAEVVGDLQAKNGNPSLSGLKNQVRKRQPDFSEKSFGYSGFLQFCKAAQTKGLIELSWDADAGDYLVTAA